MPEGLGQAAFELASLGPTSANCEPLRLVLVRSPQAKERLLSCVSSGNYEKVRTAPPSSSMVVRTSRMAPFGRRRS